MCAKISAAFNDSEAVYIMVAGDFNCGINSKMYEAYCNFYPRLRFMLNA